MLLFNFFSQLLHLHGMSDKNPRSVASALKVNPYFVNEYLVAARNYPMKRVSSVIGLLREFDVKGNYPQTVRINYENRLAKLLAVLFQEETG